MKTTTIEEFIDAVRNGGWDSVFSREEIEEFIKERV